MSTPSLPVLQTKYVFSNSMHPQYHNWGIDESMGMLSGSYSIISSGHVKVVRRRLSEGMTWKIIGMYDTGISFKRYNHTLINRLVRIHRQTHDIKDQYRQGQVCKACQREDSDLTGIVRRQLVAASRSLQVQV